MSVDEVRAVQERLPQRHEFGRVEVVCELVSIGRYQGTVLVNSHPDYLSEPATWKVYTDSLQAARYREGLRHALPGEVARWWRVRADSAAGVLHPRLVWGTVKLDTPGCELEPSRPLVAGKPP
jgi:hypothetical protein